MDPYQKTTTYSNTSETVAKRQRKQHLGASKSKAKEFGHQNE